VNAASLALLLMQVRQLAGNQPDTMSKEKIEKVIRYLFYGLPLVGVIVVGIFSTSERMHQILILAALLFFQVFILFEVFQPGNNP
jgi:hypothetical protein